MSQLILVRALFIIFAKKCLMIIKRYSKQDTSILKGFAIICICLHNFFHYLPPSPGENEFYFSLNHINNFFSQISETPAEFVNLIFSYLGHYGVQIFIFISGYGLAVSMAERGKNWLNFVVDRLVKLYPLLLTALIFYILYYIVMYDSFPWNVYFEEMKYKLFFIHTLIPKQGTSVNGPWWFFALILQLYILFPALFKFIKKYKIKAFFILLLFSYAWIFISQYLFKDIDKLYLLQNFPGHIPEFCLGILLAFNKDKKISNIVFFVAIVIFCLGNFYKIFFPFTFLAVTIMFVFAYQFFKNIPIRKNITKKFLTHFGEISMTLFAVHGFLRAPFITLAEQSLNSPWGHIYAALLFFVTVYFLSFAAARMYDLLLIVFNKIRLPEKHNKLTQIISGTLQILLFAMFVYLIYYYVSQSKSTNTEQIVDKEDVVDNMIVEKDCVYNTFANIKINKKYKTLKIEGSMDLKNMNPKDKLPPIVIEIKDVLWDKVYIPEENNTSDFNNCTFKYEYYCPFIKNLKNKDVKLYFWNTRKSNIELKNIDVSIIGN